MVLVLIIMTVGWATHAAAAAAVVHFKAKTHVARCSDEGLPPNPLLQPAWLPCLLALCVVCVVLCVCTRELCVRSVKEGKQV